MSEKTMLKSRLVGKINDRGTSIKELADDLGIHYQTFLNKLNKETDFRLSEIRQMSNELSLSDQEILYVFFLR